MYYPVTVLSLGSEREVTILWKGETPRWAEFSNSAERANQSKSTGPVRVGLGGRVEKSKEQAVRDIEDLIARREKVLKLWESGTVDEEARAKIDCLEDEVRRLKETRDSYK